MPTPRPARRRKAATLKRKNIVVDQAKLDAARQALGVTTETATVDAALDAVVFRAELFGALDRLAAANVFGQTPR